MKKIWWKDGAVVKSPIKIFKPKYIKESGSHPDRMVRIMSEPEAARIDDHIGRYAFARGMNMLPKSNEIVLWELYCQYQFGVRVTRWSYSEDEETTF